MKSKVYVVEYRFYDVNNDMWVSHLSQEGYNSYEKALQFCESRATNAGGTACPRYFQNITENGIFEEYYIHDVVVD